MQDILLHVNFTVAAEQRILGLHLLIMAMIMTPYGTWVIRLDFVNALCNCHVVEMLLYLALTSVICFSGW
jgi:hypothetical protein